MQLGFSFFLPVLLGNGRVVARQRNCPLLHHNGFVTQASFEFRCPCEPRVLLLLAFKQEVCGLQLERSHAAVRNINRPPYFMAHIKAYPLRSWAIVEHFFYCSVPIIGR